MCKARTVGVEVLVVKANGEEGRTSLAAPPGVDRLSPLCSRHCKKHGRTDPRILILLGVRSAAGTENPTIEALTSTRRSKSHTQLDGVCSGESVFLSSLLLLCLSSSLCHGFLGCCSKLVTLGDQLVGKCSAPAFPSEGCLSRGEGKAPQHPQDGAQQGSVSRLLLDTHGVGNPPVLNMEREPRDQSVVPGVVPARGTALGQRVSQGSAAGPAVVTQIPPQ